MSDNEQLELTQEELDLQEFLELSGAHSNAELFQKTATAVVSTIYKKLKESGIWKNKKIKTHHGVVTLKTWKDVCKYRFNKSESHVNEQIQNLNTFGLEVIEVAEGAGIGPDLLRKARKLEPEQLEHIKEEVSKAKTQKEKVELLQTHAEELQRQLNEQKDNAEQAHKTLEAKIEEESGLKEKWKAKFRLEQDKKTDHYSRDWTPRVSRIRYLSGRASEQGRIVLNGMYGLIADVSNLQKEDTLSPDEYQAAIDCLALLSETLLAEMTVVLKKLHTTFPGFELANQNVTAFPYTEDELKRLLILRGQLLDHHSQMMADAPQIVEKKRGPKPNVDEV